MSHGRGIYVELILRRVGGPDGGRVADWVLKTDFSPGYQDGTGWEILHVLCCFTYLGGVVLRYDQLFGWIAPTIWF